MSANVCLLVHLSIPVILMLTQVGVYLRYSLADDCAVALGQNTCSGITEALNVQGLKEMLQVSSTTSAGGISMSAGNCMLPMQAGPQDGSIRLSNSQEVRPDLFSRPERSEQQLLVET